MSGHSKWSKVKHQKEASDASKGKLFTKLANAIIIAVKQGGGITDLQSNFRLRLAIDKAKSFNMPKDSIERAVKRAVDKNTTDQLQEIVYEAFGPAGVGIIIEANTSNRQRTVAELKNILDRGGGVLAETGAVSYLFKYVGVIQILKDNYAFDQIMEAALNYQAVDLEDIGDKVEIYTLPSDLHRIKELLEKDGFKIISFELFYRPTTTIPVTDRVTAVKVLELLTILEEMEDVKSVHANVDIPDEYLK